ncbi:MAG: tRNA dihydrouridine synthase DusB [Bacteroidales bacterium]|nr:tRNA dihydrouridine synthase DusB [Lentimicrobiaceae bacterium]MDD5693973.1 tRNA dihydrouridine synthase DusB [Bacteroidales bacterium]
MQIGNIHFESFPVILAPMEDITDLSFRLLCKEMGADLVYTEFIASEGLIRNAGKSRAKLHFLQQERPVGIQIFGHDIDSMVAAARIAEKAEPDLIDINFGCPVRKVVSKGGGAALLNDIPRMVKMTVAVVKATHLPVTVKTRLGWDSKSRNIVEVAARLQDAGIKALTIHGRTRDQLYGGKADWTLIGEVKANPAIRIPVIGNGDVVSPETALEMKMQYGVDGIMIGRAAVGNPWLFKRVKHYLATGELLPEPSLSERIDMVKKQITRAIDLKGERTALVEMRKFYAGYFKGIKNFKEYKMRLLRAAAQDEVVGILDEIAV